MIKRGSRTVETEGGLVRVTADFESNGYVALDIEGDILLILSSDEAIRIGILLQCAADGSPLGWTPDDDGSGQS